jgi:small subunit ribosomal protein S20
MHNRAIRSSVRNAQRRFIMAVKNSQVDEAENAFHSAEKLIDTAARKGVYHKNTAARTKSRMQKKLNALKVK